MKGAEFVCRFTNGDFAKQEHRLLTSKSDLLSTGKVESLSASFQDTPAEICLPLPATNSTLKTTSARALVGGDAAAPAQSEEPDGQQQLPPGCCVGAGSHCSHHATGHGFSRRPPALPGHRGEIHSPPLPDLSCTLSFLGVFQGMPCGFLEAPSLSRPTKV